jgi:hypothetical protein
MREPLLPASTTMAYRRLAAQLPGLTAGASAEVLATG